MNAEITDAVNFFLKAIVSRTALTILRISRVYVPVSISDAISFKSTTHRFCIESGLVKAQTYLCERQTVKRYEDRKNYAAEWMGQWR